MNNEQIIRKAYQTAEDQNIPGWVASFTPDGTFIDHSIGVTYRGPDGPNGLGATVEVMAKAFPDMHRELFRVFSIDDVVVVELALQGTHKGPLATPMGILRPTGKRMDAPCCDVFRLVNGKIQSFNCYPSGTVIFAQLGVLSNIEAAVLGKPDAMRTTTSDAEPLAREFLKRLGEGAEPAEVAALFSEHLEWELAGDDGALPWIGRKSGRRAVADFVSETRAQMEQLRFDVTDILTSGTRAAVLGSLASKINRTGRIVETDFVIVLTVANGEIVRFQMLEDSFATARAARG